MRRRFVAAIGVAFLLAGVVGAMMPGIAGAAPAPQNGQPFGPYDFPAGEYCTFPVEITGVNGQTLHDTGQGDTVLAGPFTLTVINEDTGAMRTFNVSGPTRSAADGSWTVVTGPELIGQPASRNVGPPFLIVTTGRVTFTPEGTIATRTGAVTDVCAALS